MKHFLPGLVLLLAIPSVAQISFRAGADQFTKNFRSGVAVMVTDVNGDGKDDIVRLHDGTRLTVTLQGQQERFYSSYFYQISGSEQWNITGGDLDNDGGFDIITCGAYDRIKLFRSVPSSLTFMNELINDQTFFGQASNVVDINNDGFLDYFVCNDDQKSVIFLNDSTGNLVRNDTIIDFATAIPSENSGNYGSIWSDIDSDGDLDLYIAKCRQGVTDPADPRRINALYLNNGDNTYTESADSFNIDIGAQSWTADFGDIDNDGDFDLFITNHDQTGVLLENIDNAYFEDITVNAGIVVLGIAMQGTFRDFDNDGLVDLVVSGSLNYVYHNIGDNQFALVENPFSERPISSYGIGDLNSDGFIDIYATYNDLFNDPHPIVNDVIWFNGGNDNHYMTVHLTAATSNRDAVGSRLYLYGAWGRQTREVHAGEGYGITNSFTQHFGLGSETTADSLVIIWPNGVKEVHTDLVADRNYYIEEGKCLTHFLDLEQGPFTQCVTEPFTITAPDGYTAYLWSNGSTEQQISATDAGVFHVTLTDDTGCNWIAGPVIVSPVGDTEPDSIDVIIEGRPIACAGDDLQLMGPADAISYLWNTGETTSSIFPSASGAYVLEATYICNTFISDTVFIDIKDPNDLVAENDTILGGGPGELIAIGDSILWFQDIDGQNLLSSGNAFITPSVDTTTTFYVQQTLTVPGEQLTVGQPDHTGVTFYNSSQTNGAMRFDVFSRFRLDSVLVITTFSGERTILLLNEQEDTLYRQTFAIDSGKTYLPLNVWIEPDLDYLLTTDRLTNQMSFNVNSPRLYRSDRDFVYPFTIHDVVSLTGTASSQQFYYYFYDWHLTREDQYCTGDILPVQVVVVDTSSSVYAPYIEPLQLIPNPADEYIRIGDVQLLQDADISLYDARGVQVEKLRVDLPSASLFIGDLAEGMYYVKVIRGEKIYLGQFVKM